MTLALSSAAVAPAAVPMARASIVGGGAASISAFPFLAALYDTRAGSPAAGFFCGGVILDATHVATAAHCILGPNGGRAAPGSIAVLAGSSSLDPLQLGSIIDPVQSAVSDPRYDASTSDYDIALLKLARPLWAGPVAPAVNGLDQVAPLAPDVALASQYGNPDRSPAVAVTAAGWGDVNPSPGRSASYPMSLQAVRMPLVSDALCEEQYALIEQTVTSRMICAGGGRSHRDTCYGDSGGPLLADRDSPARAPQDYVLVGLVDFGNGCAQNGYAGVYTRISSPEIVRFLTSADGRQPTAIGYQAKHKKKRKRRHR